MWTLSGHWGRHLGGPARVKGFCSQLWGQATPFDVASGTRAPEPFLHSRQSSDPIMGVRQVIESLSGTCQRVWG